MYDSNGNKMMKETHLPLTAEKAMIKKNKVLPVHLRHTIEVVKPAEAPKKAAKPAKPKDTDDDI